MPTSAALKLQHPTLTKKIPSFLIKEKMDGVPIYYRGYKDILTGEKTLNDIMGTSTLQFIIVSYLHRILILGLNEDLYWIATGEAGNHLNKKNNLSY